MKTKDNTTIISFSKRYDTEEKCIEYFTNMRWKGSIGCPHCGSTDFYTFKDKKTYKCKDCELKFNVKTKTVFEGSKIPLTKWMMAIYLCNSLKRGIASTQLSRDLGVTQKAAWFMLQRLRVLFGNNEPDQLGGVVEVDGTLLGGQFKNKSKKQMDAIKKKFNTQTPRGNVGKITLLGMLQRGGNVKTFVCDELDKNALQPLLFDNIKQDTKVYTDYFGAYKGIDTYFTEHSKTNHKAGEYVRGNIHTNTIEGYWALVKRSIAGSYYGISRKHIERYTKEFDFRYNTRDNTITERIELTLTYCDGRLKYKDLIKK